MRAPRFRFGDIVTPTRKAFKSGVFNWHDQGTIFGVVVWCEGLSVHLVRKGRRTVTPYHISFWTLLDGDRP